MDGIKSATDVDTVLDSKAVGDLCSNKPTSTLTLDKALDGEIMVSDGAGNSATVVKADISFCGGTV